MNPGDDFERRLRSVLRGRHLDIALPPDALDRIHAAAARRQHRRIVASGSAGIAAIAVVSVVVGATVMSGNHRHTTAVSEPSAPPVASPLVALRTPVPTSGPASLGPLPVTSALVSAPPNFAAATSTFLPASVTAISANVYWVLGYESLAPTSRAVVKATTDGGQHFTTLSEPNLVLSEAQLGTPSAFDIRFADATHGWIYGGALYETDDGGVTWNALSSVPGSVVDLAAFPGSVWAVTNLAANGAAAKYGIFHATYSDNAAAGKWSELKLPFTMGSAPPSLAVQHGAAYLLVSENSTQGQAERLISFSKDGTLSDNDKAPCFSDLGGKISVGGATGVLWATCPSGMSAGVYVSTDSGKNWASVPKTGPNSIAVGAISASTAMFSDNAGDPLELLHADGTTSPVTLPGTMAYASFIGFTTTDVGFAVTSDTSEGHELWRTDDGGSTWTLVTFGD